MDIHIHCEDEEVKRIIHHFQHLFGEGISDIKQSLHSINHKINVMGQNTDKALQDLADLKTEIGKIGTETSTLLQKVTDLETAAANADTPQSVLDAIADLKSQAQTVDDLVADVAPPAEPPAG